MIYHIASVDAWLRAKQAGRYTAPSLETEGFIHCSTREQLLHVAKAFYRGKPDLCLLCIDESRLRAETRWEAPAHPPGVDAPEPAADSLFPHVYGVLNLDAVAAVVDFIETESGFAPPPDLPT